MPPAYFAPAMAAGHPPPPYMWGPQHMMPPPFGTPYAMYPHGGAYPHPLVPMMASPLSVEPAKSANSKDKSSNKKLKEIDGSAVSTGSGNSKKTSSSGDYSGEGSSDVNDLKVSGTPRKRSLDGGFDTEATVAARNKDVVASSPIIRNGAILSNQCFPAPVIKPSVTNVANSRAIGTPVSPLPGVMGPIHTGISTELSSKDEREVKREKRKQSNRESARRSRLRKQVYCVGLIFLLTHRLSCMYSLMNVLQCSNIQSSKREGSIWKHGHEAELNFLPYMIYKLFFAS
ncbi:hypothetical protein VPH35_017217 [Triticum aestivum]